MTLRAGGCLLSSALSPTECLRDDVFPGIGFVSLPWNDSPALVIVSVEKTYLTRSFMPCSFNVLKKTLSVVIISFFSVLSDDLPFQSLIM